MVDLFEVAYVTPVDRVFVIARCGLVEKQLASSRCDVLSDQVGARVGGLRVGHWFGVPSQRLVSVCWVSNFVCTTHAEPWKQRLLNRFLPTIRPGFP